MSSLAQGDGHGPVYRDHNLHVIFAITLMAVLGTTSVTPAFNGVREAFGVSAGQVGLLITVFTVPGVLLTPVLGVLSDFYGRRKILVPALLLFGVAGGACALARDFELLLALRFLQGMGAAALGSINVTMIGDIYSGWDRATAMGYNSSVLSTATASYPALGGLLAALGWYYPFALPLFAIPIGLLVIFSLRNPETHNEQGMGEYFGSVWGHLRDRQVAGLLFLSLGTFVVLFGPQLFYLPILMGDSFGSSPVFIGMVLSSASVVSAVAASQLGRLTGYFDPTTLMKASFLLYPVALCLIPLAPNPWLLLEAAPIGSSKSMYK